MVHLEAGMYEVKFACVEDLLIARTYLLLLLCVCVCVCVCVCEELFSKQLRAGDCSQNVHLVAQSNFGLPGSFIFDFFRIYSSNIM